MTMLKRLACLHINVSGKYCIRGQKMAAALYHKCHVIKGTQIGRRKVLSQLAHMCFLAGQLV